MKFSIIIAIYNNGDYLKNICFNSLKKSSMFDDMEIILVDDGSTDNKTLQIIKELDSNYKNVKTYFFNDGGSGSASRPRNYGVKLATTPYITYLDPDNEAYGDGYAKLYNEISNNDLDLVIGEILFKSKNMSQPNNYYEKFLKVNNGKCFTTNGKNILINTNFSAQSIQAALIKKELLINNNLHMVFGGAGEDTLFFYELLLNSHSIKVIKDIIHIYHMSREDSITNDINSSFFRKHLPVEIAKRNILSKHDLLSLYLEQKHDFYFKHYVFKKINDVSSDSEKEISLKYIDRMYKVFYDVWQIKDTTLKQYFENRICYRNTPFDETIIIYLSDNNIQKYLNFIDEKNKLDNIEIIIVDYYLEDNNHVDTIESFESSHKNVKLYYQDKKENINRNDLEKRVLGIATTNKIKTFNL